MSRGFYIGRFQPFHKGHLRAVKWILGREDELIIGIGSAQYSYTMRNPFTVGERIYMIWATLRNEGLLDRVILSAVPDTDAQHSTWVSYVKTYTPPFDRAYTNDPLSQMLFRDEGIDVRPIPFFEREKYSATRIRDLIVKDDVEWMNLVPKPVAEIIIKIGGDKRIKKLAEIQLGIQRC